MPTLLASLVKLASIVPVLRWEPWNRQAFPEGVRKVISNMLVVSEKEKVLSAVAPGGIVAKSLDEGIIDSVERFRIVTFTVVALAALVYAANEMAVSAISFFYGNIHIDYPIVCFGTGCFLNALVAIGLFQGPIE